MADVPVGPEREDEARRTGVIEEPRAEGTAGPAVITPDDVALGAANLQHPQSYFISHTRKPLPANVLPVDLQMIEQLLRRGDLSGVRWQGRLPPALDRHRPQALAAVPSASEDTLVAAIPEEYVETLRQFPQLVIEPNLRLYLSEASTSSPEARHPSVMHSLFTSYQHSFHVRDSVGRPIQGAEIHIFGAYQNRGITDENGQAHVNLLGESRETILGLYIQPRGVYWDRWIADPELIPDQPYTIQLELLSTFEPLRDFPEREVIGWGLETMNIADLPADRFHGQGVKIAIIDSGVTATHPELQGTIEQGFNLVTDTEAGWDLDEAAHGTHVAGVIAASWRGRGIRGIAPGARLVVFKLFPEGDLKQLARGIDRCIEEEVDIINLSIETRVWIPEHMKINESLRAAKRHGIACIVAAGNSAGPVPFPASSPHVLAVAAVGKHGTFPSTSYHNHQIFESEPGGLFSAKFSSFGPKIDVAAPGVAVLSAFPEQRYAAWDGTSMAAPHVSGLAALLLAHHPDFKRPPYDQRTEQRVDRLFELIRESARPLALGQERVGRGIPDARRAFAMEAAEPTWPSAPLLRSRSPLARERLRRIFALAPAPVAPAQPSERPRSAPGTRELVLFARAFAEGLLPGAVKASAPADAIAALFERARAAGLWPVAPTTRPAPVADIPTPSEGPPAIMPRRASVARPDRPPTPVTRPRPVASVAATHAVLDALRATPERDASQ